MPTSCPTGHGARKRGGHAEPAIVEANGERVVPVPREVLAHFSWQPAQPELYVAHFDELGDEMNGLRGPRRRGWAWLTAIAYLLASMTPSLAVPAPLGFVEVSMHIGHEHGEEASGHRHDHAHEFKHVHADGREHVHATPEVKGHSHGPAATATSGDDRDRSGAQHANCCGSVLCFSAVSPQAPPMVLFAAPRSRCETWPEVVRSTSVFRRHYRPPIA
jgi:hypothetical protein